jgi:hypothetical protein
MNNVEIILPIGQAISLPRHFDTSVVLEEARRLGTSFECRLRLPDGRLEEIVIAAAAASGAGGRR